jgi:hypothetical protein
VSAGVDGDRQIIKLERELDLSGSHDESLKQFK